MRNAINTVNRSFEAAMSAGDAAGLAAVYTPNGNALPPNSPTVSGTAQIQEFWQGVINMGIAGCQLKTIELDELGDTAIEVGEFVLKAADGSVADSGKYIVVWKSNNGTWRWSMQNEIGIN